MIPRLFASSATSFTTQGIGALTDTILCYVDEERNGKYEGYLRYPITGIHYADIGLRSIIVMKPNYTDDPQPFRVYEITKPINGVVTVYFQHISYDLSGYPVQPFTASTLTTALSGLTANCPITCPFTLTSSRSVTATFKADVPASIRSWLGGKAGSLLDVYGGEYSYDVYTVRLETQRGENRGVTIRYGKNLTDLEQEENCAAVYTGVYPYWTDAYGGNLVQITGRIVNNTDTDQYAGATYDYQKILPLDLSSRWEDAPTESQLRDAAKSYIEANELGTPKVNLSVEFAQISNQIKDRVDLCDTVTVQFERLGVSATAKCIKTRWNVLLDRYEEITLGDAKTNIAQTIVAAQQAAAQAVNKSSLEMAVDQATSLITGNSGGYVVLHDTNGDDKPDELLIMNTPDIGTATKVWRWNQAGLGYSDTGYTGTYGLAMTNNGAIVADYITTGTLDANLIKAGIIADQAGLNFWNMQTGEISIRALSEYGWNPQEGVLQTYAGQDLQTYAGDNILAYSEATYTQIQTNANQINLLAGDAAHMQSELSLVPGQITAAVTALEGQIGAELALEIATDSQNRPYGKISANADYIQFDTGDLVINSNGLTLDASGNATFSGAVTATSLTLGSGVTVAASKVSGLASVATSGRAADVSGLATVATSGSYNDLSNKPTIPSLTGYIRTDGTIGSTPAAGSTGFVVSSAGLLQASNAIIYGSLYSSNGTIGGMTLSNNAIYNGTSSMSSTTAGVYLGTGGLRIYGSNNAYFNATSSGAVTISGGTLTGGAITGATFKSTDGTTVIDSDGVTLRNAATDAASTKRLKFTLENNQYPSIVFSYRATTSDAWTTKRPIGWNSNQTDVYGFSGGFYSLDVEKEVTCASVQASGYVNAFSVIASRVQFGTTALVDASNVLIAD